MDSLSETLMNAQDYDDSQAGGHAERMSFEGLRLIKKPKPSEILFYLWLYSSRSQIFDEFKQLIPAFYGVERRGCSNCLILENLLIGCSNPNILDCKIGKISWASSFTQNHIEKHQNKNKLTTTSSIGIRVTGIVINDKQGKKIEVIRKKNTCSEITEDNIHEYLRKIVMDGERVQTEVVRSFITKVEKIKEWFEKNTEIHFKKSSVLFIIGKNGKSQVKLIDFSITEDAMGEVDNNVLDALKNLIRIWQKLL